MLGDAYLGYEGRLVRDRVSGGVGGEAAGDGGVLGRPGERPAPRPAQSVGGARHVARVAPACVVVGCGGAGPGPALADLLTG